MASIQSTVATNGPAASSKNTMILRLNELGEIVATLTDESKQLKKGRERDQARIQALEGEVAQIKDALEAMKAQPAQEDLEDEGSGGELDDETKKKLELSTFHANSNIFKGLVCMIFNELMGLPKTSSVVPPYPEDESAWPMNEITKQRHLRFRWDKLARDKDNDFGIRTICSYIVVKGASHAPAAGPAIAAITAEDLYDRVMKHFQEMAKNARKAVKKEESVEPTLMMGSGTGEEPAEESISAKSEKGKKEMGKSVKQSRQKGKYTIRQRKYDSLADGHLLKDPKFVPALTYMLMSEDDDVYEGEDLVMGRYESHAPLYRSKALTDFYEALDKEKDPAPTVRYIPRVRGDAKDIPPPTSNKLKNKARRWMIDAAWLAKEENNKYDVPSCLAESGKLWGDEDDPEDLEAKAKKVKEEKQDIKKKMRLDEEGNGKTVAYAEKTKKRSRKVPSAAGPSTNIADDWFD